MRHKHITNTSQTGYIYSPPISIRFYLEDMGEMQKQGSVIALPLPQGVSMLPNERLRPSLGGVQAHVHDLRFFADAVQRWPLRGHEKPATLTEHVRENFRLLR